MKLSEYYTVEQVAKFFGLSRSFIVYAIDKGMIKAEQNRQPNKMGREVVLTDVDSSGCLDAKSEIKPKGEKK